MTIIVGMSHFDAYIYKYLSSSYTVVSHRLLSRRSLSSSKLERQDII